MLQISEIYRALERRGRITEFSRDYMHCDPRTLKKWCCNPRYFDLVNACFQRFAADYFVKVKKKRKPTGRPIQKGNLGASPAIRAMIQDVMSRDGDFWGGGNGD